MFLLTVLLVLLFKLYKLIWRREGDSGSNIVDLGSRRNIHSVPIEDDSDPEYDRVRTRLQEGNEVRAQAKLREIRAIIEGATGWSNITAEILEVLDS